MIGDRLRVMREGKNISQVRLRSVPGCCVAISPEWKTDTRFRPLKRSKSSRGHWKCRSTNSSMMVKNRYLNVKFPPSERRQPATRGATPERTHAFCSGFAGFSAA